MYSYVNIWQLYETLFMQPLAADMLTKEHEQYGRPVTKVIYWDHRSIDEHIIVDPNLFLDTSMTLIMMSIVI